MCSVARKMPGARLGIFITIVPTFAVTAAALLVHTTCATIVPPRLISGGEYVKPVMRTGSEFDAYTTPGGRLSLSAYAARAARAMASRRLAAAMGRARDEATFRMLLNLLFEE